MIFLKIITINVFNVNNVHFKRVGLALSMREKHVQEKKKKKTSMFQLHWSQTKDTVLFASYGNPNNKTHFNLITNSVVSRSLYFYLKWLSLWFESNMERCVVWCTCMAANVMCMHPLNFILILYSPNNNKKYMHPDFCYI